MSDASWKSAKLNATLKRRLKADGPERGGVVTAEGKVVEFENTSPQPTEGFLPEITIELLELIDAAVATWHTHPGSTANLSSEDWMTFVQWPNLMHAIVGSDGVRWYRVEKGAVINAP